MKGIFAVEQVCFFFRNQCLCIFLIINSLESAYGWNLLKNKDTFSDRLEQMDRVSLILADQNLDAPVSSFGHILLVFHNEIIPEPDSLTVEYYGNLRTPFFLIRSLFGYVPGVFHIHSWNQRFWEYEREDRDIWVIPLKLKEHEKQNLIGQVRESLDQPKPYNFFFHNCASYLLKILRKAIDVKCPGKFYTSPIGVLQSLYKCQKIDKPIYLPSGVTRLIQSIKILNKKERAIFKKSLLSKSNIPYVHLKNIFGDASKDFKVAVTEWIDYRIPRTDKKEDQDQLFKLKKQYHKPLQFPNKDLTQMYTPRASRMTLQYWPQYKTLKWTLSLSQMRFLSALDNHFWADRFEILTLGIGFNFYSKKLFLAKLNILDISTNTSTNIMKIPFAKDVYLGYQKYSINSDSYWEKFQASMAGGLIYNLTDHWKLSFLGFLQTGLTGDQEKKLLFLGAGLTGRMFIRFASWMRLKAEFRQTIVEKNAFIDGIGYIQFIFYDYKPLVGSLDYSIFHADKEDKWFSSLGLSLSYLF